MPKDKVDQDEFAIFFDAMKDVKRLSHDKVLPTPPTLKRPKKEIHEKREALFYFQEDHHTPSVTQEEYLLFKQPGIPDKLLRKLKKGQYNVHAILDLHGLTTREAEIELSRFLNECALHNQRVVLLIHGKGKDPIAPILKNKLNQWLRHYKDVLAFCTALPRHGGKGALYVLLKDL